MNSELWKFCAYALSGIGLLTVALTVAVLSGQIKFAF
jgi:hypothetical protein